MLLPPFPGTFAASATLDGELDIVFVIVQFFDRDRETVAVTLIVPVAVVDVVAEFVGDCDIDDVKDEGSLVMGETVNVGLQLLDGVDVTERDGSEVAPGASCCVSLPHSKLPWGHISVPVP